ncbi:MAG TPA: GGDEF domain-containing protein [Polyangia bacterium]|nr:GGDEF domain-containing protein [Polyangia bacterium]
MSEDSGVPDLAPEDETMAVSAVRPSQELPRPVTQQRTVVKILSGHEAGRVQLMTGDTLVVGRASTCDLRIDDSSLSRQHCRIRKTDGVYFVEDLESRNGTQVDGLRIKAPVRLEDGALIQLAATTIIMFSHQEDLEVQAEQRLYASAVLDPLTGLHNRRHLDARLKSEFAFANRHGTPLSVLLIDIDHFKKVNDTYGHLGGDAALKALADRLQRTVRIEDIVARYGGEEFAVVARGIEGAGALLFAERIRDKASQIEVSHEEDTIKFTISVGVVTMTRERIFDSIASLLKAADDALYKAKETGRNRCVRG